MEVVEHDLKARITPLVATADRPVTLTDVAPADAPDCLASVRQAFNVYPPQFVGALVKRVALAEDVKAWDRHVSGVQVPGTIVVSCFDAASSKTYLEASLHDSMAALVILESPPDWSAWQAANPHGFAYGNFEAYKVELGDTGARELVAHLNIEGFVSRYGVAGRIPDFESYAEQVFGNGMAFATLVREHEPMQRKLAVLMQTYLGFAPALQSYFDSTGLTRAARLSPAQR